MRVCVHIVKKKKKKELLKIHDKENYFRQVFQVAYSVFDE
jgi:hypothetical protein